MKLNVDVYLHLSCPTLFQFMKKLNNWNSEKTYLVDWGCLLVVWGRLLVVCGHILVICYRLQVVYGPFWWFAVIACFSNYIFFINIFQFLAKLVSFIKLAISLLVANFASFNLALKFSSVKLNSGVVIYLPWSGIFFSISPIFCVILSFFS